MTTGPTIHTEQIVRGDSVVSLRRFPLKLTVVRGPDRGLTIESDADRVVIGTHESCDLVLSDPRASRHHCELALVSDGYRVSDLSSTNGTFLGEIRVESAVVAKAIRLKVGGTLIDLAPSKKAVELAVGTDTSFGPLKGRSAAIRRVFDTLKQVAPTDTTVLLTGESGTGKEVAARAIHEASARADRPFIVVDCAALPPNLIESELFGHERGAFTGALRDRAGAFELAAGGTVFLDEIGEMPLDLQSRLLGVLERRQVVRVGSGKPKPVDFRLISATNRDLRRETNRGSFREDLYFRLAVVTVTMPALRERPEDIPVYVERFLAELAESGGRCHIDDATMAQLKSHSWPGNVRELRNALERAAAIGSVDIQPQSGAQSATSGIDASVPYKIGKAALVEEYELKYVTALMEQHQNNITRAARAAEIDRVYLLRLLDKYDMRPGRKK